MWCPGSDLLEKGLQSAGSVLLEGGAPCQSRDCLLSKLRTNIRLDKMTVRLSRDLRTKLYLQLF